MYNAVAGGVTPMLGHLCSRVTSPGCIVTMNKYTIDNKPFGGSCRILGKISGVLPMSICVPKYPPHPRTFCCNVVRLRHGIGVRGFFNKAGEGRGEGDR